MIQLIFSNGLRKSFTVIAFLFFFGNAYSQPLFIENFNFSVRDSLENVGGWLSTGALTPYNIKVVSPGLTYAGYQGSGIGNSSFFMNQPNGDVILHSFPTQTSGTVYMSFMLRVDSLTSSATSGYNICLDQSGGTTNFNTKIYIRKVSSSTFNIGISKSTGSIKYSPAVYSKNTTYLIICSYTFVSGSNNDIARLHINTSGVPATEPASASAADTSGGDINDIGDLILNNSFIQTGLQGSPVRIDGIRIGNSWNSMLFQNWSVQLNLRVLLQGFYRSAQDKMIRDTVKVYLRYKESPYTIADSSKVMVDSLGNGIFTFSRVGNRAPYYYAVRHRNTIETWSYLAREFEDNTATYNFTNGLGNAYGNNQIFVGSRYCLYGGDVNQDGTVDATDGSIVDNGATNFLSGYVASDLNGDSFVDASDLNIVDNNSFNFISKITP